MDFSMKQQKTRTQGQSARSGDELSAETEDDAVLPVHANPTTHSNTTNRHNATGYDSDEDDNNNNNNAETRELIHVRDIPGDAIDEEVRGENTTSNLASIMNLLKANVGTGILAMPNAFTNVGWAIGPIAVLVIGFLCVHCMHILVQASHYFCRRFNYSSLTYPVVVQLAFKNSPLHRYARAAQLLMSTFLFITQIGFCCVYIVFVARSINSLLITYWHVVPIWQIQLSMLPFLLMLVAVRDLRHLAHLSLIANVIMAFGLAIIMQASLSHLQPTASLPAVVEIARWPKFFGPAIFAFEGIGCVLPIENKMTYPQDFGGWTGVLNLTMVVVAVLYCAIGFFGYLAYGNTVAASITYSLPPNFIYQSVKALMAVAIFLSYGVQFYVPMRQLILRFRRKYASVYKQRVAEHISRLGLLLLTLVLAMLIPHLAEFIALIGAFASSFLAIIFPPILDLVYRCNMQDEAGNVQKWRYGKVKWRIWKNIGMLIFGLVGFVLGTFIAVQDIVEKFKHPDES